MLFLKMKELSLNNIENNQYLTQNEMWGIINEIGWYYLARDYGSKANDKVAEFLLNKEYTVEEISEIKNFIVRQREIVKNFIHGYLKGSPKYIKEQYKLGDDSTWDLASHIVGMGKVMMDFILGHPELLIHIQKNKRRKL